MTTPSRAEIVAQILSLTDYNLSFTFSDPRHPAQGQFVITGPQITSNVENRIGFCVQIRRNRGQFGSDMVFLRHPCGGLTTHENQSYFGMTPEQELLARSLFEAEDLPENEDYSHGYLCCGKVHETGFIVDDSASQPTPDTPFTITVRRDAPRG